MDGGEVFWLDTEGTFAPARVLELVESMLALRADQEHCTGLAALERLRARPCASLQEMQEIAVELLKSRHTHGLPALVVVDSVAAVARNEGALSEERRVAIPKRQAALSALASHFKAMVGAASATGLTGVVVTNQVMSNMAGRSKASLGHVWHHAVNWRLLVCREQEGDVRQLHVEKSPSAAPLTVRFKIGSAGLHEVS